MTDERTDRQTERHSDSKCRASLRCAVNDWINWVERKAIELSTDQETVRLDTVLQIAMIAYDIRPMWISTRFDFWPRNVVKRGICYESVCPPVYPFVSLLDSWVAPRPFKISKYALHHIIERCIYVIERHPLSKAKTWPMLRDNSQTMSDLSLIHIWRCRRSTLCRSRWSPYH